MVGRLHRSTNDEQRSGHEHATTRSAVVVVGREKTGRLTTSDHDLLSLSLAGIYPSAPSLVHFLICRSESRSPQTTRPLSHLLSSVMTRAGQATPSIKSSRQHAAPKAPSDAGFIDGPSGLRGPSLSLGAFLPATAASNDCQSGR